ncbi:uncharacterized protein [Argopecten irradians]|uniref:uncharacterized protein n=1 Tax=Argopecten irradians TaxID=31199 RepID=UPI003720527B
MISSGPRDILSYSGTTAENERAYPIRVQALTKMAYLSCAMAALGVTNTVLGIVIVVSLDSDADFPLTSGASIWCGVYMVLTGLLGIFTSRTHGNLKQNILGDFKCKLGLFYGMSVGAMSICGISTGYNGGGLSLCVTQDCSVNDSQTVIVCLSAAIGVSVALLLCGICGMVFFFWYRNAFQMYSAAYRAMLVERQVENLQRRLAQAESGNAPPTYGGVQTGQVNGGYTNWNKPPPAYSEKQ